MRVMKSTREANSFRLQTGEKSTAPTSSKGLKLRRTEPCRLQLSRTLSADAHNSLIYHGYVRASEAITGYRRQD